MLDVPQSNGAEGRQKNADRADHVRRQRMEMISTVVFDPHRPDLVERQVQLYSNDGEQQHGVTVHADGVEH